MLKELSENLLGENFTHCVVCWSKKDDMMGGFTIYHICGYPSEPSKNDIETLVNELKISDEFNMNELVCGKDYQISLLKTEELATIEMFVVGEEENVSR